MNGIAYCRILPSETKIRQTLQPDTKMNMKELLEIAIQHEIGSQKLYRELQSIVADPQTILFLNDLIKEEEGHEAILRSIIDNNLYDLQAEFENPEAIDRVRTSHSVFVQIDADSKMEEVMQLALQREYRAKILFQRLGEHSISEEQRLLFSKLEEEESSHQDMIEKRFSIRTGSMGLEM